MAYDAAAQFLAWVVPWPLAGVEPPEFFINIHAPSRFKDRDKLQWGGRACTTLKEALNYVTYIDKRSREQGPDDWPKYTGDLYVCMSAQRRAKAKTNKAGRVYYGAVRGDINALWHKSFYIDVDGKDGDFRRFAKFLHDTGLPFPTFIVASGSPNSYHVHWVLADRITSDEWLPLSQMLVTAMQVHGFKCDYACTTDVVRVLRIPDTWNHKTDPPLPVTLRHAADSMLPLSAIADPLLRYKSITPPLPTRKVTQASSLKFPEGFGAISSHAGPVTELAPNQQENLPSLADLRKCCPFVDHAAATHGADFPEPLWFETVKLAFYLREGLEAAHEMSRGYGPAAVEETTAKYETEYNKRWPVDNYGWPTCMAIKNAGSEQCNSCRWMISGDAAAGKHPFNFLSESYSAVTPPSPLPTPEVTEEELVPPGYILKDYLFWKESDPSDVDENGVPAPPKLAMRYRTRQYRLSEDHWLLFEHHFNNRWRPAIIPISCLSDSRSFARTMGNEAGIAFTDDASSARRLMAAFVEMLRDRKDRIIPTDNNGWNVVDGIETSWTYGTICYNGTGNVPSQLSDRRLQDWYKPTGKPEPFLRAMKMINDQGRPALDMAVAASFGAPFMHFTGQHGIILSLRSTGSARGKSSCVRVGQAAWGDPKTQIHALDDTTNAINIHLARLRNLPCFYDEMAPTYDNSKSFINTLFSLGQGKSKSRAKRTGDGLMEVYSWSTIMIAATNGSLASAAESFGGRSEAGVYRVWEVEVPPRPANKYVENFDGIMRELDNNFGHAGAAISAWLGPRAKSMKDRVMTMQESLRREFGTGDAERFHLALATCVLMGAAVANAVKVANFDISTLHAYLKAEFQSNQRKLVETPVGIDKAVNQVNYISNYLNDAQTRKLRTDIFAAKQRGQPHRVNVIGIPPDNRLVKTIAAQIAQKDKLLRISRADFARYMKQHHNFHDRRYLIEFEVVIGMKQLRGTLAAGTTLYEDQAQEYLLELDLNRPELQELLKI